MLVFFSEERLKDSVEVVFSIGVWFDSIMEEGRDKYFCGFWEG